MRVLLAEDDPDYREMLSRRLERRGLTVDVAENGALAVAAANSNLPDLVLMDLAMPIMSGLEATRALRAAPGTAALKIIAVSGLEDAREQARAAGCDGFAPKPVDFATLLETIRTVTGVRI